MILSILNYRKYLVVFDASNLLLLLMIEQDALFLYVLLLNYAHHARFKMCLFHCIKMLWVISKE